MCLFANVPVHVDFQYYVNRNANDANWEDVRGLFVLIRGHPLNPRHPRSILFLGDLVINISPFTLHRSIHIASTHPAAHRSTHSAYCRYNLSL